MLSLLVITACSRITFGISDMISRCIRKVADSCRKFLWCLIGLKDVWNKFQLTQKIGALTLSERSLLSDVDKELQSDRFVLQSLRAKLEYRYFAVRVDLVTSWLPSWKKRRATSWLLRGRQDGLTQVDKLDVNWLWSEMYVQAGEHQSTI